MADLLGVRKAGMVFAAAWMDLAITLLSEVSQTDKYPMMLLMCGI